MGLGARLLGDEASNDGGDDARAAEGVAERRVGCRQVSRPEVTAENQMRRTPQVSKAARRSKTASRRWKGPRAAHEAGSGSSWRKAERGIGERCSGGEQGWAGEAGLLQYLTKTRFTLENWDSVGSSEKMPPYDATPRTFRQPSEKKWANRERRGA